MSELNNMRKFNPNTDFTAMAVFRFGFSGIPDNVVLNLFNNSQYIAFSRFL